MDKERIDKDSIEDIKKDICKINEKLDTILSILQTDCKKMADHVDFIEEVYDHVKTPFHFIMDRVTTSMLYITEVIPKQDNRLTNHEKK